MLHDGEVEEREKEDRRTGAVEPSGTPDHEGQLPHFTAERVEAPEQFNDLLEVAQPVSDRAGIHPHFPYLPGQGSFYYVTLPRKKGGVALSGIIFQSMDKEKCYI